MQPTLYLHFPQSDGIKTNRSATQVGFNPLMCRDVRDVQGVRGCAILAGCAQCAICAMCRRSVMINTKVGGATGLLDGSDEDCLQVNEIEYPQSAQSKK